MGPGPRRVSGPASRAAVPQIAVVAARNEADRIGATIAALREASPGIAVFVADDASTDGTAKLALAAGATVISRGRPHGKGANMTAACEAALDGAAGADLFLLCDGDLGSSAGRLLPLLEAVENNDCDLAIAVFTRRVGGGVGAAKGFARWAIRNLGDYDAREPISGQRAMRASTLRSVMPFAGAYGMETGMTIDALRAGHRLTEIELELEHRATGQTAAGFLHRGRQLRDIAVAYAARRRG